MRARHIAWVLISGVLASSCTRFEPVCSVTSSPVVVGGWYSDVTADLSYRVIVSADASLIGETFSDGLGIIRSDERLFAEFRFLSFSPCRFFESDAVSLDGTPRWFDCVDPTKPPDRVEVWTQGLTNGGMPEVIYGRFVSADGQEEYEFESLTIGTSGSCD